MTVSDLPLASATADLPKAQALRARVRTRVRARVATAERDAKSGRWVTRMVSRVALDARRGYLLASRPVSLRAWLWINRRVVAQVPDGNLLLRGAARADQWTTGLVTAAIGTALYLLGAGFMWVAAHPVRRWVAILLFAAWLIYALAVK